jgi:hypothetical protein
MRYHTQFAAPWMAPLPTPFPGQLVIFPSDLLPMRNPLVCAPEFELCCFRLQVQDFTVRVIMKSDLTTIQSCHGHEARLVPRITPQVGMRAMRVSLLVVLCHASQKPGSLGFQVLRQ